MSFYSYELQFHPPSKEEDSIKVPGSNSYSESMSRSAIPKNVF